MGIRVQLLSPETGFPGCNHFVIPTPSEGSNPKYDPLNDDKQAMALVKRFQMDIQRYLALSEESRGHWEVVATIAGWDKTVSEDLNRAIVECIAKVQKASNGSRLLQR